jgi:hypothetical protein
MKRRETGRRSNDWIKCISCFMDVFPKVESATYLNIRSIRQYSSQPLSPQRLFVRKEYFQESIPAPNIKEQEVAFLICSHHLSIHVRFMQPGYDRFGDQRVENLESPVNGQAPSSSAVIRLRIPFKEKMNRMKAEGV